MHHLSSKSFLLIIGFFIIFLVSGCGSDQTPQDSSSSFTLPTVITQARFADSASIHAYLQVDNGLRQEMLVSGSNASIEIANLSLGSHQFTISIEYTSGNETLVLAQSSHTADITSGSNTPISFADADYNFQAFDEDRDGISNLDEVLTNNADLHAITLSTGNLNETFDSTVNSYTASVAYGVTDIQVTAIPQNSSASLTINGVNTANNTASAAISLDQGSNSITVSVTSEDGSLIQNYSLTITRLDPVDNNADLQSLQLSAGSLNETFQSDVTSYSATVPYGVTDIQVTANPVNNLASLKINSVSTANNAPSPPITLAEGSNTIAISVRSGDGTVTQNYVLTITRAGPPADNATLQFLQLSVGSLNETFASDVTSYSASVAYETAEILVTANPLNSNAELKVNSIATGNNTASAAIALVEGNNTITVNVTSEDGTNTMDYVITVTRLALSTDIANLSDISLSTGSMDQIFQSIQPSYTANADWLDASVQVTAVAQYTAASVSINGVTLGTSQLTLSIELDEGDNMIEIIVTAADNITQQRYTVTVTRQSVQGFAQRAYVKASNTGTSDYFGTSVAIDGDTLVVGAYQEDSPSTGVDGEQGSDATDDKNYNSGAVYIFTRSGSVWTQQAFIKASNTGLEDFFGYSVAIDGDTLVVGARGEDSPAVGINGSQGDDTEGGLNFGAVYVYTRSGSSWSQQAYIKASNTGRGDEFGYSVDVDGDTLVVGAIGDDSSATGVDGSQGDDTAYGNNSGAVYVFTRSGSVWSQQAYIKASNTGVGDWFGISVAVDGNTLVVGAQLEDSMATGIDGLQGDDQTYGRDSGAVYVFTRGGSTWSQQAYIKASNTGFEDRFGTSVDIDGDTLVVGAYLEDSAATVIDGAQGNDIAYGSDSGAVYVFTRNGAVWSQQSYIKASNTGVEDWFGTSIAIDGDTLVVGANLEDSSATDIDGSQGDDSTNGRDSGAVYLFTRSGSVWLQRAYIKASNTGANDGFGRSVAVDGDTLSVGAYWEDSSATFINGSQGDDTLYGINSGAAYVFR